MKEIITSLSNPAVKNIIKLRQAQYRKQVNLTIVEGFNELSCLLQSSADIVTVYLCEQLLTDMMREVSQRLLAKTSQVIAVNKAVYEKISFGNRSEGVCAVVSYQMKTINDITCRHNGLYIVAQGLEKPGNLGAILRTCDAACVDAIFLSECKMDALNHNLIRASIGTLFTNTIIQSDSDELIPWLFNNKVQVCVMKPDGKTCYTDVDLTTTTALVIGNEAVGVGQKWINDHFINVSIPMSGKVNSINVSNAAAIMIYEAGRQRKK